MQRNGPSLSNAVGVLQHRDFRLFYVAILAANLGAQLQNFTNILQIYDLTHSPFQIGLTGLARAIPFIGLALIGGVVADRMDRRRTIMAAQATNAVLALLLATLTATQTLQVWHIYAVTFVGSAMMAFSSPSRTALIPSMVPRDRLMNALALNSTTMQLSTIVGPTLAGMAVGWSGFATTYFMNGAALLVTLACLAAIPSRPVSARRPQSTLHSILEGVSFVRSRSIILALLAMDTAAMLFGSYRVVLPVIGDNLNLDPARLGVLFAAPGVGSLLGATVVMSLGDIRRRGVLIVGAILVYCAMLVLLAISPWFLLALFAAAALGLSDSLQATPRNALIQAITPDEIRGRVEAFRQMLTGGMPALGQVYMGGTASLIGAPLALIGGAIACATVVIGITLKRPDIRAPDLGTRTEPSLLAQDSQDGVSSQPAVEGPRPA
jgi:MFS family permease